MSYSYHGCAKSTDCYRMPGHTGRCGSIRKNQREPRVPSREALVNELTEEIENSFPEGVYTYDKGRVYFQDYGGSDGGVSWREFVSDATALRNKITKWLKKARGSRE